jgi:transposase
MLWVVSIIEQKSKQIGQIKKVRGLLTTIEHLWKKLQEFGFSW